MNFLPVHLAHAQKLINEYNGSSPFSQFLRNYFRQHKKLGSRDRRIISMLSYQWFRNSIFTDSPKAEAAAELPQAPFSQGKITQFDAHWGGIDQGYFLKLTQQPSFWIRVLKQKDAIRELLKDLLLREIQLEEATAMEIKADAKLEQLLAGLEHSYRIQDISSQRILDDISLENKRGQIWDCCAGGGGKSLLIEEKFPDAIRYASDARTQALENLQQRFITEKRKAPQTAVIDLQKVSGSLPFHPAVPENSLDMIIADVPCSGSGTWRRTPERFSFFTEKQLEAYTSLQRNIIRNVLPYLKTGGQLVYVTCSAFAAENEQQVSSFSHTLPLQLHFAGYLEEGDTLFRALFVKQ